MILEKYATTFGGIPVKSQYWMNIRIRVPEIKRFYARREVSMGGQLSMIVATLMVLAVIFTSGLIYQQAQSVIRSLVISDLQKSASMLNDKVSILIRTIDSNELPKEVEFMMVQEKNRLYQKGWSPKLWIINKENGKTSLKQAKEDLNQTIIGEIIQKQTGIMEVTEGGESRTIVFQYIAEKGWYYVLDVSDQGYLAPVKHIRAIALLVGSIVLILGVGIVFWLIRRLLRPLSSVRSAMNQAAAGDLTVRIQPDRAVKEVKEVGLSMDSSAWRYDSSAESRHRGRKKFFPNLVASGGSEPSTIPGYFSSYERNSLGSRKTSRCSTFVSDSNGSHDRTDHTIGKHCSRNFGNHGAHGTERE